MRGLGRVGGSISYADRVLSLSPHTFYKLNETSGTTSVDSSPNGRDGATVNSPLLGQPGFGDSGLSYRFQGVNGQRITGPIAPAAVNQAQSLEFVLNPSGAGNIGSCFYSAGSNQSDGGDLILLSVELYSDGLPYVFYRHNGGNRATRLNSGINQWYHVVFVIPNGAQTTDDALFFINGVAASIIRSGGSDRALKPKTDPAIIGSYVIDNSQTFDGRIGSVATYSYELSASQISDNYQALIS